MSWTHDDWSALGSVLSGTGTIFGASSVLIAAIIGANTFNKWRRQKLSERRIEQAERILTATYKARRALAFVRSPMVWANETAVAEEHLKKASEWSSYDDRRKTSLKIGQAYLNRLNMTLDERRALDECLPMARALFGESVEAALEMINRQFQVIAASAEALPWTEHDTNHRREIQEELSSASSPSRPNTMNKLISTQIKLIEYHCLPVLRLDGSKPDGEPAPTGRVS